MQECTKKLLCDVYNEYNREFIAVRDEKERLEGIAKEEGFRFVVNPVTGYVSLKPIEITSHNLLQIEDANTRPS